MNKKEFIRAIATKASLTKAEAGKAVEAVTQTVEEALKKGDKVLLLGFGTFSVVEKAARKGINPQTKQPIDIPARKAIKFKPGSTLSEAVKD
jgi:DNA-binding protein HU-beta